MTSPRRSYRARLAVASLDSGADDLLRSVDRPGELVRLDVSGFVEGQTGEADMVLLVCTDAAVVSGTALISASNDARQRGMLVAAALTGNIAMPGGVTDAEEQGLALLREAVDMVVMVRDGALVLELLDVLRGGREGSQAPEVTSS